MTQIIQFLFICLLFTYSNNSLAIIQTEDSYFCVHQTDYRDDKPTLTEIYGVVHDSFDECPQYNTKNNISSIIDDKRLEQIIFDEQALINIMGTRKYEKATQYHEHSDPKLASCRFGLLF